MGSDANGPATAHRLCSPGARHSRGRAAAVCCRDRRRGLRAHRGLPAVPHPRRHPFRGGGPARWPRAHPRRHRLGWPAARCRQRVHRPQRRDLPLAAQALRRAGRAGASHRDEHERPLRGVRAGVCRRPRAARRVRPAAPPHRPPVPPDAVAGQAVPPARPGLPAHHRRREPHDLRRVPGAGGVQRLLHRSLRRSGRLVRVVRRAGDGAGLPGPVPVPVPRPSRHAPGRRVTPVVHRRRRVTGLRRAARRAAQRRARGPCRHRRHPARGRRPDPGRHRAGHRGGPRRHRDPRRPGPGPAHRPERRGGHHPQGVRLLAQRHRAAHRQVGPAGGTECPGVAGTTG